MRLFRDVFRDDLQFQPVIERREDLFLRVIEIRNLIGRGKKGDRRYGIGPAFIGVFSLVERRQKRVQNAVIAFEDLIQKHNVSLRNLARGLHDRFTRMQCGDRFAVGVQLIADLCQLLERRRLVFHLRQTIQKALQIKAQVLVDRITLKRCLRHRAGDQTRKAEPSKELFFIRLLGKQAFKLLRARDTAAKGVDRVALGLTGIAQNKQVLPRQERNGNQFDQFFTFCDGSIHVGHDSQHFIS